MTDAVVTLISRYYRVKLSRCPVWRRKEERKREEKYGWRHNS